MPDVSAERGQAWPDCPGQHTYIEYPVLICFLSQKLVGTGQIMTLLISGISTITVPTSQQPTLIPHLE